MSDHQHVEPFPPTNVPALSTHKPYHLQHVRNFRLTKRRAEGRHCATTFGDNFTDLAVRFTLHSLPEIRRLNWQRPSQRAVPLPSWSMATEATLRIKRIHPLIAPTRSYVQEKNQPKSSFYYDHLPTGSVHGLVQFHIKQTDFSKILARPRWFEGCSGGVQDSYNL